MYSSTLVCNEINIELNTNHIPISITIKVDAKNSIARVPNLLSLKLCFNPLLTNRNRTKMIPPINNVGIKPNVVLISVSCTVAYRLKAT